MKYNEIIIQNYESPCGNLMLGSSGDELCLCVWQNGKQNNRIFKKIKTTLNADFINGSSSATVKVVAQLEEYFSGERKSFDIPLLMIGSDFQKNIWSLLLKIQYGDTISYKDLANMSERPGSCRAVANANAANPISIFVPCHRVIGSDRSLTGYAGGILKKRFLLTLENISL